MTRRQEVLIRRAAEATRKSVTEFVLNSACSAAENALLDQKLFFADDESWQAFVDAMERSAKIKPRLGELMRHRAPWEKQKTSLMNDSILNRLRLIPLNLCC